MMTSRMVRFSSVGGLLLALILFMTSNALALSYQAGENVNFDITLDEVGLTKMPPAPRFYLEGFDGVNYPVAVVLKSDRSIELGVTQAMPAGSYVLAYAGPGGKKVELRNTVRVNGPVIQNVSVVNQQLTAGNQVTLTGMYFGSSPSVSIQIGQSAPVACQLVSVGADQAAEEGFGQVMVAIPRLAQETPGNAVFVVKNMFGTAEAYYDANSVLAGTANSRGTLVSASEAGTILKGKKWDYLLDSLESSTGYVGDAKRYALSQYLYYVTGDGFGNQYRVNKYDVKIYKITYWTVDDDEAAHPVMASGVVIVPQVNGKGTLPFISFQHGTMIHKAEAPTSSDGAELGMAVSYAVADGFVVSMMDHQWMGEAGIGALNDTDRRALQPYCQEKVLAMGAADMMIAAKSFLSDKYSNITLNNKQFFLTGYSEGAYATLALLRELETNEVYYNQAGLPQPKLTACGDGPYSLAGVMRKTLLATTPYPDSAQYFAPLILTTMYKTYLPDNKPADYFKRPYDISVADLMNGYVNSGAVNFNMPKSLKPAEILTDKVTGDLKNCNLGPNSIYPYFVLNDLAGNNPDTWMPEGTLMFYHGKNDDCVPYQNAEEAYKHYRVRNVSLQTPEDEVSSSDILIKAGMTYHVVYALHVMGEIWYRFHNALK
ncbi:MAG: hypothetical protein P4L55_06835 [Syntrophobacteraceae bacterium]|nr:hypothetical protein [Syntrophobacteraceae bacterium]